MRGFAAKRAGRERFARSTTRTRRRAPAGLCFDADSILHGGYFRIGDDPDGILGAWPVWRFELNGRAAPLGEIRCDSDGFAFGNPSPIEGDVIERINEMRKAVPRPDFACDTGCKISGLDEEGTP